MAIAIAAGYLLVQCAERGGPVEVIRMGVSEFRAGHRAAVAERARVARTRQLRDSLVRDSVARAAARDFR